MSAHTLQERPTNTRPRHFPETLWADISAARNGRNAGALRDLATAYWRPLYLYLRGVGHSHEDASDHVQGFMVHVFSSDFFSRVDREGGKFRSFLLSSLQRWLSKVRAHDGAQRRGAHLEHVPLDELNELRDTGELDDSIEPDVLYDRRWAIDLVERANAQLREEYAERGRSAFFETLSPVLPGGRGLPTYQEIAAILETSEGAVKKAVFDLRTRFTEILRREIRATVRTYNEADEELRYLVRILANHSG